MRRLILLAVAIAGCSGGEEPGKPNLTQQYQQTLNVSDARSRAIRLIQIAYAQDKGGDVQGAQDSLSAAAAAARAIENKAEKAETLASVAYADGTIGWIVEASKLVKELRSSIAEVENKEVAAATTAKMAVVYGKHLNNAAAADSYIKQAEALAGEVESPEGRAAALLAVAGRYHELDQTDEGRRVAAAAWELARTVEDLRARADALAEVGARLHRLGRQDQALAAFDEAVTAADSIAENYLSQSYALLNIVAKLAAAGQKQQALVVLDKSEKASEKIQDQGLKGPLMTKLHQQRSRLM